MSVAEDYSYYTSPEQNGGIAMDLAVDGVTCGGCVARIENAVRSLPGVTEARLNFTNRRLHVAWRKEDLAPARIVSEIEALGYKGRPFRATAAEEAEAREVKNLLRCLGVAGFGAMNVMLLSVSVWSGNVTDITAETRDFFHWTSALIALPAAFYAGRPFFRSAFEALKARTTNMDVPISLGVILALGLSVYETAVHAEHAYFDSALMLLFFLLLGRVLDHAMRRRTRAVATNLAALKSDTAQRLKDGEIKEVPVAALRTGDHLLVRPGDRVPADGRVVAGRSEIDESIITGETAHRQVDTGASIYTGSLNYSGALRIEVTALGADTLIDEIERLLAKAAAGRSRIRALADKAAGYYAPVVHSAAALTAIGWLMAGSSLHYALVTAISVLIITCPCALALAIPAVQVVASGALFRSGIILNGADALERLAKVDTVVFDKTGTLTSPDLRVENTGAVDPALLRTGARLALSSRHPLARALAREAMTSAPFDGVVEESGRGIRVLIDGQEARLGSLEFCGLPTQSVSSDVSLLAFTHAARSAVFEIRQSLRPDAAETMNALRALGLSLHIMSGDRSLPVSRVAATLGIESWHAAMKPAEKIQAIEQLKAKGRRVLMVGDGVNDAPALAAADVSISPSSAADIAQAHADALFLGERLLPVVQALLTARRARHLMTENLWLAVIYNAVAVPIAVIGALTPFIAAIAMSASSLLVTLNAFRARGRGVT
ncbi:MAG: cadmium-translocating P-type ATPase [Pseudolabrys sp.]|nr:cadmium-translocating P-type ATPase [Pseudolabrys sp.]